MSNDQGIDLEITSLLKSEAFDSEPSARSFSSAINAAIESRERRRSRVVGWAIILGAAASAVGVVAFVRAIEVALFLPRTTSVELDDFWQGHGFLLFIIAIVGLAFEVLPNSRD